MTLSALLVLMLTAVGETPTQARRLVDRALSGDRRARRLLVRRLMPVVRATVAAHLKRVYRTRTAWGDLDDYAQEVWLSLWANDGHKLVQYDAERGLSLESYVAVLAHRTFASRLRVELAQKRGGTQAAADAETMGRLATAEPDPEQTAAARDVGRALGAWLESHLPAKGQAIFRSLYSDGRSPAETARALGCSTQVVYNWQHKIRGLAREFQAQHA